MLIKPQGSYFYPHFTDDETGLEKKNNKPTCTELKAKKLQRQDPNPDVSASKFK